MECCVLPRAPQYKTDTDINRLEQVQRRTTEMVKMLNNIKLENEGNGFLSLDERRL